MRTPNNRVKYASISHNICNINIDFILTSLTKIKNVTKMKNVTKIKSVSKIKNVTKIKSVTKIKNNI